jgi:hypothetical protein
MIHSDTKTHQKNIAKFVCENCDFTCSKKGDWDRHLIRPKHLNNINMIQNDTKKNIENIESNKYVCECGNMYKHHSGLWRHKQKCISKSDDSTSEDEPTEKKTNELTDKDLIMMLIKENSELKAMMMKVLENGTTNNSHNTTNTNSHNKAFNLQFFLNETCKDAMNIMDFVESIQLQLSDLEKMGEIGYVDGISNIIVKNLNALDVTQRPVHCTDKKRETIYIKDEDKWEKDEEKNKIRKVIKKVATKNARLIQKFKEKHPDYNEYHSKYSTQYHKLIIESMGGSGDNDLEKEDKIIRNIAKNIVVDKGENTS